MKMRFGILLAAASLATLPACAHVSGETLSRDERSASRRVMPASGLACPRDRLTSYNGQAVEYTRRPGFLRLRILTEWDTQEAVQLALSGAALLRQFRIDGQSFAEHDWAKIEATPGELREGVRVIAWICADPSILPVIDWRPHVTPTAP